MAKRNEVASLGHSSLIAAMPSHLQAYVSRAIEQIGSLGADEESLWRASDAGEKMEMAGRLIAGRANKELCPRVHNISEELQRRGKTRRAFYQSIEIYDAYEALPDGQKVEALAAIGFTKSRALLPWTQEERLALASGEKVRGITIDDALAMPSREFDETAKANAGGDEARKLKAKLATLETRLESVEAERDRAKGFLQNRLVVTGLPEFCLTARGEAAALTEQADAALDGLTELLNDNLLASHDEVAEAERYAAMAAGTYYHSLRAIHARAGQLLQQVEEHFGEAVTEKLLYEHQLKAAEVDAFKHAREIIVGRLKTQASNREAERENAKEGKRGRKRTVRAER